ncbi:MAG TPA: hypothetical protein VGE07_11955 [Herpetosiphonaceae bacterium]
MHGQSVASVTHGHDELFTYAERVGAIARSWSADEIARQITILKLKPGNDAVRQATLEGLSRVYREKTGAEQA